MTSIFKQLGIVLLLTLIGSGYSLVSGLAPAPWMPPEIGPGEIRLADARVLDVIWVDARDREAFDQASVPDAIHFDPFDDGTSLTDVIAAWLLAPRVIVVYCADAGCGTSRKVAEILRTNLPEAEIYSLKGGWEAWAP